MPSAAARVAVVENLEPRAMLSATRFTVVGMPDTQVYSWKFPQIFKDQTNWIVKNRTAQDVQFVSQYGDVVQHGYDGNALTEWANATAAMKLLMDSNIPMAVVAGNHDVTKGGSGTPLKTTNFLNNFGPQKFANRSWFAGASPTGLSTCQIFGPASGQKFLAISLYIETPRAELSWAQSEINAHPNLPVMITTHKYFAKGEAHDSDGTDEKRYNPGGMSAPDFFRSFVQKNPHIFLVNAGHYGGEYRTVSKNSAGLPVYEVTADYQDGTNGGNGYLRLMHFDIANNKIDVETYSPTLKKFDTDSQSKFSIKVNFSQYKTVDKVASFQNGVGGYGSTQDTWVSEAHKNTSYGSESVLKVDDDVSDSHTSDDRAQGLIKFDKLIGAGLGQIPEGAKIVHADLKLTLTNAIIDPTKHADFDVRLMSRSWSETSTWNSLSGGLSPADYGALVTTFLGANSPAANFVRHVDITSAVQQWASGLANNGLAIMPQIVFHNDDGIRINSSEASSVLFRPVLEVEYVLTK